MTYKVNLLSIPNHWLSYYIYGFVKNKSVCIKMKLNKKYLEFNFTNRCVLEIIESSNKKTIVIDTDDYTKRHEEYASNFDYVFLSQKLKSKKYSDINNVYSLPPHFPVNTFVIQKLLGLNILRPIYFFKSIKEMLITWRLKSTSIIDSKSNKTSKSYIFYHRSLWKNEYYTNLLGAIFLDTSKDYFDLVEGGLHRTNDFKTGNIQIDKFITKKRYSSRVYINKLKHSYFCLNTPAVRGSCSWRFGEYLALNKRIISTPFMVEVPQNIKYYEVDSNPENFKRDLENLFSNKIKDNDIDYDNSDLFQKSIQPIKQIDYILKVCFQ